MDSFAAAASDVPSASGGGGAGGHGKKAHFGVALSVAIPSSVSPKKELKMRPPVRLHLLLWPNNVAKGCVIETVTHAIF